MKEITRIHLAKVAYDIELDAKKDIQKYVVALERYTDDPELLDDIEIRMTELLAERNVPAGGVITADDVAAVRGQLGEPSDFAPEGEVIADEVDSDTKKRFYRDNDHALLGGVLAGMAQYFGINPLWTRLLFAVLLLVSFGTVTVVYVVLWLLVPAAKTAAEKLQMQGRPVTLASIKQLGDTEVVNKTARTVQRVLRYTAGVVLVLGAIGAIIVTLVVGLGLTFADFDDVFLNGMRPQDSWWAATALALFAVAGLLLATLGFLLADAVFRRRFTRRIGVAVIVIVVAGLAAASSAVIVGYSGATAEYQRLQDSMETKTVDLPATFADVKKLAVTAHTVGWPAKGESHELAVEYVVDERRGSPRYELTALPGTEPSIVIDGDTARVAFKSTPAHNDARGRVQPRLVIRGPAIEELEVRQGIASYSAAYPNGQQSLVVKAGATTRVSVSGVYQALRIEGEGDTDVSSSSIVDLTVDMKGGSVAAGVVRTLTVTQPDSCSIWGSHDGRMQVQVRAVSGGAVQYNGERKPVGPPISNGCGVVLIEDGSDRDAYEEDIDE